MTNEDMKGYSAYRLVVRNLTCSCCGESAGRWEQHWNRENGYGICARCIDWLRTRPRKNEADRETPQVLETLYGVEGVNWGKITEETTE